MAKLKIISFLYSYDKIIELNPNNYFGLHYKGDCLQELKRFDEALKWLNLK